MKPKLFALDIVSTKGLGNNLLANTANSVAPTNIRIDSINSLNVASMRKMEMPS